MIGLLVELIASWILLHFVERKNLNALGFSPSKKRLAEFAIGVTFSVSYVTLTNWFGTCFTGNSYRINEAYTFSDFLSAIYFVFKSVAFEDLIFRGALFYILVSRLGVPKALVISSVAFGLYHWVSFGVFGQPVPMIFVLVITGLAGFTFAYAFIKTGSMYLAVALHLGYNIASMIIFSSKSSIGNQLFVKQFQNDPTPISSAISILMIVLNYIGYPLIGYFLIKMLQSNELRKRENI
ncbi:hypothetical protein WSM22_24080 [Cytophagales bacterium WSM2-2]|nr:hypothetical protein WSM22_24080 [Cytophagales bacterium WSM2-2]